MKTSVKQILLAAVLFGAVTASAVGPGTISENWSGSQVIPDNNASGVAFAFNIAAGDQLVITNVEVSLNIAGGWNGDLYAYLSHGSGFAVLLNRPGRTAGNSFGSGGSGMSLTLSDSYLTDVHTAANDPLSGNFAPDARFVNPVAVLDTDARTAFLSSFTNLDPNGTWTLFLADVSPLGVSTIQNWTVSLGVTVAVPEPGSMALLILSAGLGAVRRGSQRR
jgi:subtilisin-like proprotein convertase family protein